VVVVVELGLTLPALGLPEVEVVEQEDFLVVQSLELLFHLLFVL
jgi:hypothetical protein